MAHQAFRTALATPTPDRALVVAQALRAGISRGGDPRGLQVRPLVHPRIRPHRAGRERRRANGLPKTATALRALKALGFSDKRLAKLAGVTEAKVAARARRWASRRLQAHRHLRGGVRLRHALHVLDLRRRLRHARLRIPADRAKKIIILGGGPNRIGQGIEFDYCCVHAAYALRDAGFETIMVNCNPETVSTDYDTSDRLYFEPLTAEDVIALIRKEQEKRRGARLHRAVWRADAAEAVPGAAQGGHPDPRHQRRGHRHRRGPRALPAAAEGPRPEAAAERHARDLDEAEKRGRAHRLPGRRAPVLRARRPRDGDLRTTANSSAASARKR
jgi:hypothetical protein